MSKGATNRPLISNTASSTSSPATVWRRPVTNRLATPDMQGKQCLGLQGLLLFTPPTYFLNHRDKVDFQTVSSPTCALAEKKALPHTGIILQSFNSLTRVKSVCLPMQLAFHPHLQRLGKETHFPGEFHDPSFPSHHASPTA